MKNIIIRITMANSLLNNLMIHIISFGFNAQGFLKHY